jgi:hypothetical protein
MKEENKGVLSRIEKILLLAGRKLKEEYMK